MTKRRQTKEARKRSHVEMMAAFVVFLDQHWPLWREDQYTQRYVDLQAAFKAGWNAA